MPLNTWSDHSNVVKLPFKTLMSVDIETGIVSFNHPFESIDEIIAFQGFLMDYGVQDITIKDAYGLPVWSFELLIGETTFTLSHEAIALCALALEQENQHARRTVDATRRNISLILPTKKSPITSSASV